MDKNFTFSENGKVYWVLKKGINEGDRYITEVGSSNVRAGASAIIDTLDDKPFNKKKGDQK